MFLFFVFFITDISILNTQVITDKITIFVLSRLVTLLFAARSVNAFSLCLT